MHLLAAYTTSLLALFGAVHAHSTEDHRHGDDDHAQVTTLTVPTEIPSASPTFGCPTVTETRELCSSCIIPACIVISTLTNSCDCPDPVPTVYLDFPCENNGCAGAGCTTDYTLVPPEETCRPVESVTDYLDTPPSVPSPSSSLPPVGANTTSASSAESTLTTFTESTATAPPQETVSGNAAGRMAIPFAGWF